MIVSDADVQSVVGAFWQPDLLLFRALLARPANERGGDLAELGVLYGKSAVLMGSYVRKGETFTVIDLFETEAGDAANLAENESTYPGLSRRNFEDNYLRFHSELPKVVQGPSDQILQHTSKGTHRFVHVDASHLYEHVVKDIASAKIMLQDDGVLVLDDYRSPHTPGVAAAAWASVLNNGLIPFAITPQKMYATWGDVADRVEAIERIAREAGLFTEIQVVHGHQILRVGAPDPSFVRRFVPEATLPALRVAWRTQHRIGQSWRKRKS